MHRSVRAALAALAVAGLAGCWPAPGQGPDRRGHNPWESGLTTGTAGDLAVAWEAVTDPDAYAEDRPPAPTVSGAAVHVSDNRSAVYAFHPATGEPLWEHREDGIAYWVPSPLVEGRRVLAARAWLRGTGGAWGGESTWLDAATGAELGDGPGVLPAGRRGGRTLLWSLGGGPAAGFTTYALGVAVDGDPLAGWAGTIAFNHTSPEMTPTLGAHRVYHAGAVTREYSVEGGVTGVHAFPLEAPATDCVAPHPEYPQLPEITCPTWTTETGADPVTSPVVGPGEAALYVGLADGTLLALDTVDGSELWRAALGAAPSADPALADGRLFVPLADGTLAVVDAATGTRTWAADLGGAGVQPAVAGRATPGADGVVVVGTDAGDVVALPAAGCGAATCAPVATVDVGGAVTGAPAVSGGRAYVGVAPNRVVALSPAA